MEIIWKIALTAIGKLNEIIFSFYMSGGSVGLLRTYLRFVFATSLMSSQVFSYMICFLLILLLNLNLRLLRLIAVYVNAMYVC